MHACVPSAFYVFPLERVYFVVVAYVHYMVIYVRPLLLREVISCFFIAKHFSEQAMKTTFPTDLLYFRYDNFRHKKKFDIKI